MGRRGLKTDLQVTYIPGLPAESTSPKKTAKRRKKKKNEPTNLGRENGHRGSTSSESEVSHKKDCDFIDSGLTLVNSRSDRLKTLFRSTSPTERWSSCS